MAKLARGSLRKKRLQLVDALGAEMAAHQRQLLGMRLGRVETAEAEIAVLDREIEKRLEPYAKEVKLLMTIPGIDWVAAAIIIAGIGTGLSSFPSADRLAAWGGMCPGSNESAGKRKPAAARKGNPHLKTALCNAAIAASRKRGSYFKSKYHQLKSRRGGGRAALAIGHKLLVRAYHILTTGSVYKDLGEGYSVKRDVNRSAQHHLRRLRMLGFDVTLTQALRIPEAAAA